MSRAARLAAALLLTCLGLVFTVSAPASADCTCKQATLDKQVAKADLIFIGTIVVVDVIVMWFFFAAAAKGFRRFTSTARGQRILNLVFGTLFIFVAALLALVH